MRASSCHQSSITASSDRCFKIVGSDYIFTTLVAPLIASLQTEAPFVRFETAPLEPAIIQQLERGEVDLVLTPRHFISPNHPAIVVFEEPHVVVGWSGNPHFADGFTLERFLESSHVAVQIGTTRIRPFAEQQMEAMGLKRRLDVIAPTFAAVPWLLPNSMRIAVLHQRLAETFAKVLPLAIAPLPFEMPLMEEMAQFHITRERDAGLLWLLERMKALVRRDHQP